MQISREYFKILKDLIGVIPIGGPQEAFIEDNKLRCPPRPSPFLELCEEKPEMFSRIKYFSPNKQNNFEDPWFSKYIKENQLPIPDYSYYHSETSELSSQKGIAKYCRKIDYHIHEYSLNLAWEWIRRTYRPFVYNSRLTSLATIVDYGEMDTSPGPLWRKLYTSKRGVWEDADGREMILSFVQLSKKPGGPITYWGLFQKDELRAAEKVEESKTRQFLCAPVEHHSLGQIISLDFNEKIMYAAKYHKCPISVGMTIFDSNFHRIGIELEKCSQTIFDDVSGFDSSMHPDMLLQCAAFRFDSLHPSEQTYENLCMFANYYRDVISTLTVLPDGCCVFIGHTPSGYVNTAIDNSLMDDVAIAYSWIASGLPQDYDLFTNSLYRKVYGDDNIIGVRSGNYNSIMLQSRFRDLGLETELSPFWEYLGHYIVWDSDIKRYVPVFPTSRAFAALSFAGSYSFYKCASKAMSLRISTYTNKSFFPVVDKYCQWLLRHAGDDIDRLSPQYVSVQEIIRLLKGRS
jgi:hypothetical protein